MELVKDLDQQDTPPEAIGEQAEPVDPSIVGSMEQNEVAQLTSLQNQSMNIQTQIGGLEVRKAQMLGMMQQIKDQGQSILDGAAQRLGIKPGEQWSVGPDGVVRRGPAPGGNRPV